MAEEYAVVLDYMPEGKISSRKSDFFLEKKPLAQVLGVDFFTLLEVVPKEKIERGETVYIGKGIRDKISQIKRRVLLRDLTNIAREDLEKHLFSLVEKKQEDFINFFNNSGPLSIKMHCLELLPNIGKTKVEQIIKERNREKFRNFRDIDERTDIDSRKLVIKRILQELSGDERYYVFTKKPFLEEKRPKGFRPRRFFKKFSR